MANSVNTLGQPIGGALPNWVPCEFPPRTAMHGRFCRVEPLSIEQHTQDLFTAFQEDKEQRIWTYLPYGPFNDLSTFQSWVESFVLGDDPLFYAIIDSNTEKALGVASYMRIEPEIGVIEVGGINYAPSLQRTPAATEAMYLMMRRVFADLGYRRYEWKCDTLNAPSRRAARRLGFSFEGIFRQATIYKKRNRDTAWFSILDSEWPTLERAYEAWLADISPARQQKQSLSQYIERERGKCRSFLLKYIVLIILKNRP